MRKRRILLLGAIYYIFNYFDNVVCELFEEKHKLMLLNIIKEAKKRFKCQIKNVSILDTHFHMIIKPTGKESLSEILKWIKQRFSQKFNRDTGHKGGCWADRFSSRIIEAIQEIISAFLKIAYDAVKWGLAEKPADYWLYKEWENPFNE